MFWFPLTNIIFLVLIFRIHRRIFWIVSTLEILLYVFGVVYIEETFTKQSNLFLHYLALSGAGLVVGATGIVIALMVNARFLYDDADESSIKN